MLTPGLTAFITDLLFRNGISAVNGFFANEDIILTLDESYASRAFESLRSEIRGWLSRRGAYQLELFAGPNSAT